MEPVSDKFILEHETLLPECWLQSCPVWNTSSLNQISNLVELLVKETIIDVYKPLEEHKIRFVFYIKKKKLKEKKKKKISCCHQISNWNKRGLARMAVQMTLLATAKLAVEICTFWSWIWPRSIIVGAGFQSMDFITNPWNSKGLRFHEELQWYTADCLTM